ncbi:excisionase family DNA binding protein [Bradyrhizobium sp. USDA 4518]
MLKLLRELTELVSKHPGIAIAISCRCGEILGISRPTVVRLMEAGELPFRFEGKHHRGTLEDVARLKAASVSRREVDELVLGTTNAPYKSAITAAELTRRLASGKSEPWTAVDAARATYKAGANDMSKGAAKPQRAKLICSGHQPQRVQNWFGKVATLSSNGEGKGVLAIMIGNNVRIKRGTISYPTLAREA